ncbi:hypothetical protein M422DRAFT_274395 [Sphaerobolus stellatus SS14]|uniref:CTLH/CRA C-terminal to LisH motif domain-containing protein n=1 Tax=Sphaerobolus stellatus (strain SS14) TaxID=990650 RepID=A0A0C9UHR2_SPHS4|nr:hypothetical protein M422DRAFT_274395 [Sphaerobolus stellatus SS14]
MSSTQVASFAAAPEDLRRIVLDYLCSKCYIETAKAFARESFPVEFDPDGDEILPSSDEYTLDDRVLRVAEQRREIRARILDGQIPPAIELLNLQFPSVLSTTITPNCPYDPAHLILNLQVQHFIEQARTIPLPWPSDLLQQLDIPTRQSSPILPTKPLDGTEIEDDLAEQERKSRLLRFFNELHALVHALPSIKQRNVYIEELSAVGGLLVYPVPERSKQLRQYLDMQRREAVADQINDAILFRTNSAVPSIVELMAQQTTVLYSTLNSLGRPLPPEDERPLGFASLLSVLNERPNQEKEKGRKDIDGVETYPIPSIDLEALLRAKIQ